MVTIAALIVALIVISDGGNVLMNGSTESGIIIHFIETSEIFYLV